ncbi:hypothetical protein [Bacillus sp. FJAT-45350]|nr:hypothetical protein [Bacillus sp. FJAT-45350]
MNKEEALEIIALLDQLEEKLKMTSYNNLLVGIINTRNRIINDYLE